MRTKLALAVLACLWISTMSGVTCDPVPSTFQVTFPAAGQTTSQDFSIPGGKLQIRVQFNDPVDMASIVRGTNVILHTEKVANATITVVAGATANEIVVTSVQDYGDLLIFDPDGFFDLTIIGSGARPVRNTAGDALDGDADGVAGGDWNTGFVLLG